MKLPQLFSILGTGNTRGVNLKTFWMEIGCYIIGLSYGYVHGYHLTTYMEYIFLTVQNVAIIFLVMYYDRKWTLENWLYTLICVVYIAISSLNLLPHPLLSVLLSLTLPLAVVSKLEQIRTLYRIKSRGGVSVLTWSLAAYGCVARLFTVYVEVGDLQILLNFLLSAILNSTVVFMCLYYGDNLVKKK